MDKPTSWLEVSLITSGEVAEAVAEVFSRFAPDGVVLHSVTAFDQAAYEERPTGAMKVAAYLPNDANIEDKRQHIEEAIWHLGQIMPLAKLEFKQIEDQDWMTAWKEHYRPLEIGRNLIVLPAWVDPARAGKRLPIIISPDMSFGTGTHPSTQLCMVALEKYGCRDLDVLDIGCGSGILSIQALRQGAKRVLGVDNDPLAIPSCERNAALNGLAGRAVFEVGTHSDVLARGDGLNRAPRVLANILAPVLNNMLMTGLGDTLTDDGLLILGGILDNQAQSVVNTARENGLRLEESYHSGDWVVLVFAKAKNPPPGSAVPFRSLRDFTF